MMLHRKPTFDEIIEAGMVYGIAYERLLDGELDDQKIVRVAVSYYYTVQDMIYRKPSPTTAEMTITIAKYDSLWRVVKDQFMADLPEKHTKAEYRYMLNSEFAAFIRTALAVESGQAFKTGS